MALFDPAGAQVSDAVTPSPVALSGSTPSRSRSVTETINGSHHFTIQGYSLAKGMGVGKYIASDTFTVGGYRWAVYFYPDGKNQEDQSMYVSVFIALASEGTDVRALFELTLLDQSGKGKHKVHSHFDRALESGPYTLKYRGSMWGYKRFFKRTGLENSDFLKNDSLVISCTVGVVVSSTQGPRLYTIPVPESNIGEQFGALLDEGTNTDITFLVGSESFKAHKLVLAVRSPFFRAQLYGPLADSIGDTLEIQDIEPPVFKVLLHFIYHDNLPETMLESTEMVCDCPSYKVDTMMAQHLLAAADHYCLDRLKVICESRLCKEINVENVATTLSLADQHHASQLKSVCLKFAAANLAVAGVDEDASKSTWAQLSDGTDASGRRVRQRVSSSDAE
ncbi:hypothetical protein KP509_12G071100 [Ceratopteris richardii]|uniref:BTB/POZ and MATH domain-containing protein 3 n=1 Tax=Ceratopteris richardii TaxID=49495 RepID=A0A8T2TK21_CERRI|nr:hypothetical protein KP509_12G071100 [Ceratopteris richardii]